MFMDSIQAASHNEKAKSMRGFLPSSSSDGFRFSCDRTSSSNDQQFLRNFQMLDNNNARSEMGLCQNLSKMCLSDEQSFFTGSHLDPTSRYLHGFLRPDLDSPSSRRQASLHQLSMLEECHNRRLLDVQEIPNPNLSRHNRDYIFHHPINQQIRPKFPLFSTQGGSREDLSLDLETMVGIYGSVYLMAKDQMGSKVLQKFVERASVVDVMIIFQQVIHHVTELGTDQFGNYFVQRFIQVCSEEQRTQILINFTSKPGLLVTISLDTYGTRVVQKLIETVTTKEQIDLVKAAVKGGFISLVRHVNGNHVINCCLQSFGPNHNKFILEAATRLCAEIATHRYGCLVLQRCILCSAGEEREKLLAEISRNSLFLAQDTFGNYVVQYIIEQRMQEDTVMFELRGNYVKLARQKFSSHVVEKCLQHYPASRGQIVRELVSVPNFEQLLKDPFANYVIKSALSVTKGNARKSLVEKVQRYGNLRTSPHCKHIFSRSSLLKM